MVLQCSQHSPRASFQSSDRIAYGYAADDQRHVEFIKEWHSAVFRCQSGKDFSSPVQRTVAKQYCAQPLNLKPKGFRPTCHHAFVIRLRLLSRKILFFVAFFRCHIFLSVRFLSSCADRCLLLPGLIVYADNEKPQGQRSFPKEAECRIVRGQVICKRRRQKSQPS
jgi:hypothetical protein